ncbi:MAG: polyprenyl synthetase family protein [Candidatus Thorarchaeota archaeon]
MVDRNSPGSDIDVKSQEPDEGLVSRMGRGQVFLKELERDPEIAGRMYLINDAINRFIDDLRGEPKILYDAASYLLRAGGKRLRSLITILSCEAVGGDPLDVMPFAIAVELVQTASLIHDDIIDDDTLRRGVETTHKKFGSQLAVLAGDLLVAQAIHLIGKMGHPELMRLAGHGGILLCEGEVSDMLMGKTDPTHLTIADYLKMIERKTAALMRVAAGVGVLVGGGNDDEKTALMDYAEAIGMAFQIRDDVLNLTAPQDITGKSMLTDLKWERSNFVLVHCLETAPEDLRVQCVKALQDINIEEVLRIIEVNGSIEFANEKAQEYAERAKDAIRRHRFSIEPLFEKIADFVVTRAH